MLRITGAGPGKTQEPKTQTESLMWLAGTKVLELSLATSYGGNRAGLSTYTL